MTSAVFQSIGVTELLIVLGIVLLILGPKRLPGLGRQLGSGMREFKDAITGRSRDDADDAEDVGTGRAGTRPALPGSEPATVASPEPETLSGDVVRDRQS